LKTFGFEDAHISSFRLFVPLFNEWRHAMAKKKLEVSLKPIKTEIDKAEKELKSLKSRVSRADRRKVDSDLKDLVKIRALVIRSCRSTMTHIFVPKPDEE
jgi:hypothetical protein